MNISESLGPRGAKGAEETGGTQTGPEAQGSEESGAEGAGVAEENEQIGLEGQVREIDVEVDAPQPLKDRCLSP